MKSNTTFRIGVFFMIIFVFHLSSIPLAISAWFKPKTVTTEKTIAVMTQEELQSAVISYANRFFATIGQASFQLEKDIPTSQGRLIAAARKVYSLSAATEIAAGPNAGPALLDLVVIATLNRMVWEEYWRPQVFGTPATVMVDAFKKMEVDAWDLATKVMTPEQCQELRDLIFDWYSDNPGQVAVDYIRFSDFGDLGKKPNLKEIQKPGGLLAPVREATAAVDEVRMTSERAMFLLTKMQLIMGFQVELVYKQLVMQPEMNTILKDISGFRATADRFAELLGELPKHVADERSATITDVSNLIARERKAVLNAIDDKAAAIYKINTDVQATLERVDMTFTSLEKTTSDIERLLQGTQQTAIAASDLLASLDKFMARFEPDESSDFSKPFDINEYINAIEKVQATVSNLNQLALSIDKASAPLITSIMEQFNESAENRIDHIFWRLIELFSVIGVIVLVVLTVHFMLRRKISR
ncbi:MAG: hypothetical protein HGJ94_04675 [Desulfosarcina sp.]|nr:hypothetical protein [Desulfosarcina sp.]MBC2744352.1 hypothetical protein [Desulfosarcina sp.]MBC2767261.1 hypothetical protein [Desulfosarcina sp.]